jgi:hypothetical protein
VKKECFQGSNRTRTPTPSFGRVSSFIELAWLLALAYGIESFLIASRLRPSLLWNTDLACLALWERSYLDLTP